MYEEKLFDTQNDISSKVDHDPLRPLQDEAFTNDLFMDLFSDYQFNKERLEEGSIDDDSIYDMNPQWKNIEPSVIINELLFPHLDKDTMEIEKDIPVEVCP